MIPFVDLKSQYQRIQSDLEKSVLQTLRSGQYILGPNVEKLEATLQTYVNAPHVITCSSGTDALLMALMAKGVGPGKIVFTTPFTFIATAEVIARLGAIPVFVDVDPKTYNLDPKALKLAIEAVLYQDPKRYPLPKALCSPEKKPTAVGIIAVDLFGLPCDYQAINQIAYKHGLFVIEDAAQSFGARFFDKKAGALAGIACTSFYPPKPLACYGDGGAIFCQDPALAKTLRSIRTHGQAAHPYKHTQLGLTGRLDEIQATILLQKLKIFDSEFKQRQKIATCYHQALRHLKNISLPIEPVCTQSAWGLYSIVLPSKTLRDQLQARLQQHQIPSIVYYPLPLHQQPVFAHLEYKPGHFPQAEKLSQCILSLPMHPYLTSDLVKKITDIVEHTLTTQLETL